MRVFILSTFFCFSFISSGLSGVSGSSSMYRSGMRTLSGVDSWGAAAGVELSTGHQDPSPRQHPPSPASPSSHHPHRDSLWLQNPARCRGWMEPPAAGMPQACARPSRPHLLVDIHVVVLRLQLHLAQPGDLLPGRLVDLAGVVGAQRCLQVRDVHLVDAAVPAHLRGTPAPLSPLDQQTASCHGPRCPLCPFTTFRDLRAPLRGKPRCAGGEVLVQGLTTL